MADFTSLACNQSIDKTAAITKRHIKQRNVNVLTEGDL